MNNSNNEKSVKKHYIKVSPEMQQMNKSIKMDVLIQSYKDVVSDNNNICKINHVLNDNDVATKLKESSSNIFNMNSLSSNKLWLKPILNTPMTMTDDVDTKSGSIDNSVINSDVVSNNVTIHVATKSLMSKVKTNNETLQSSQYTYGLLAEKIGRKLNETEKQLQDISFNDDKKISYKISDQAANLQELDDQDNFATPLADDDDEYKNDDLLSDGKLDDASMSEDSNKYRRKLVKFRNSDMKFSRIWSFISKKEIPKIQKQKILARNNILQALKKISLACQKEIRKEAVKSQKINKDMIQKSKKIAKEMLIFWKKFDKVEKETRKKVEKEAMEMWKQMHEMKELKRQQRKLNFLITQTELYAHFMRKKSADMEHDDSKSAILKGLEEEPSNYRMMNLEDDNDYSVETAKNEVLSVVRKAVEQQKSNVDQYKMEIPKANCQAAFDENFSLANPDNEVKELVQPLIFKGTLKKYQIKGLSWLAGLYDQGINGILADEMGLGKTVQTISFLSYLAESQNIWGPFMIVAPASTLHNWQQEINKFVPEFKVLPYWGDMRDRKSLRQFWNHNRNSIHSKDDAPFHILITSYQLIVSDIKYFQRIMWQYLVLDEAQSIKSSTSQRWKILLSFKCRNRLLLTGTPIQNTMAELWALLHFIMPTLFDNHQEFNEWFSKDIEGHVENKSSLDQTQLTRLHLILKPFMLRRIKKDVENELSDKIELKIDCQMTNRQKALYKSLRNKITLEDLIMNSESCGSSNKHGPISLSSASSNHLMNLVMQFRKVCNHPELFERRDFTSPYFFNNEITFDIPKLFNKEDLIEYTPVYNKYYNMNDQIETNPTNSKLLNMLLSPIISLKERYDCVYLMNYQPFLGAFQTFNDYSIQHKGINHHSNYLYSSYYPSFISMSYIPKVLSQPINTYCSNINWHFKNTNQTTTSKINLSQLQQTTPQTSLKFSFDHPKGLGFYHPPHGWSFILPPDQCSLIRDSGKLIELDNLLTKLKSDGHKVLVYSQMTKMIDILEEFMVFRKHKYMRLDGSSKISDRRDMVSDFQSDSAVFVFLLSTRAGGLGINLTAADTVIFYDSDWNPTVDQQAMDRAHRLGQTRQVTVYRLIMSGTIEERILKRAKEKSEIQSMVITGNVHLNDATNDSSLKPKEVVSLLLDDDEMENKYKQKQEQRKLLENSGIIKKRGRKRKLDERKDESLNETEESNTINSSLIESDSSLTFATTTKDKTPSKGKSTKQKTASVLEKAASTIGKNIGSVAAYASYGLTNHYYLNQPSNSNGQSCDK